MSSAGDEVCLPADVHEAPSAPAPAATGAVVAAAGAGDVPLAAPEAGAAGSSSTVSFVPLPNTTTHDLVYCCRKCRQPLFRPSQITTHEASQHDFSYRRLAKDRDQSRATEITPECTSYFLEEPVQWMKETSEDVEGKLNCPKCAARVGLLKWTGNQCSCGTWVTPAIQMSKKAVDERWFPKTA